MSLHRTYYDPLRPPISRHSIFFETPHPSMTTTIGPQVPVLFYNASNHLDIYWRNPLPGDTGYNGVHKHFFSANWPAGLEEGGYEDEEQSWEDLYLFSGARDKNVSELSGSKTPVRAPAVVVVPGTEDRGAERDFRLKDRGAERDFRLKDEGLARLANLRLTGAGARNSPPIPPYAPPPIALSSRPASANSHPIEDSPSFRKVRTPAPDALGSSLLGRELSRPPSRADSVASDKSNSSRRSLRIQFKGGDGEGKRLKLVDTNLNDVEESPNTQPEAQHDEQVERVRKTIEFLDKKRLQAQQQSVQAQQAQQAQVQQAQQAAQNYAQSQLSYGLALPQQTMANYLFPPTVPTYQFSPASYQQQQYAEQAAHYQAAVAQQAAAAHQAQEAAAAAAAGGATYSPIPPPGFSTMAPAPQSYRTFYSAPSPVLYSTSMPPPPDLIRPPSTKPNAHPQQTPVRAENLPMTHNSAPPAGYRVTSITSPSPSLGYFTSGQRMQPPTYYTPQLGSGRFGGDRLTSPSPQPQGQGVAKYPYQFVATGMGSGFWKE